MHQAVWTGNMIVFQFCSSIDPGVAKSFLYENANYSSLYYFRSGMKLANYKFRISPIIEWRAKQFWQQHPRN